MNLNYSHSGKPITDDELRAFEAKYNLLLPEDYRQFLLKYNGGLVEPNFFEFCRDDENLQDEVFAGWFYRLNDTERVSLEQVYLNSRRFVLSHHFVIADDLSKNSISISIREEDFGAIYYEDTDTVDEDGYVPAYYVAPSFTAFLEMLHD